MSRVIREFHEGTQTSLIKMIGRHLTGGRINPLLFVDDVVLVSESSEQLQCVVTKFGRVYERRNLRTNV